MKTNLIFIQLFLVVCMLLCAKANAQSNSQSSDNSSSNTFSIGQNDFRDFSDSQQREQEYYDKSIANHVVMPETLPASQDTNDIWGNETNGLQLSIRFRKDEYVAGEMIPAITIFRNLESYPRTLLLTNSWSLFLTFMVNSGTNGYLPERVIQVWRSDAYWTPPQGIPHGLISLKWDAKSEKVTVFDLNRFFDLKQPAEYTARVICRIHSPETKLPLFEVSSGATTFRIVPKPSPIEQNTATNGLP